MYSEKAINTLQILFYALGAGLAAWGISNMREGYKTDDADMKHQGFEQLKAGADLVEASFLIPARLTSIPKIG